MKRLYLCPLIILAFYLFYPSTGNAEIILKARKDVYYFDETVQVDYAFPDNSGNHHLWYYLIGSNRRGCAINSDKSQRGTWTFKISDGADYHGSAFLQLVVGISPGYGLYAGSDLSTYKPLKSIYIPIAHRAKPSPGALRVLGGNKFKCGDEMKYSVKIPEHLTERFSVGLYGTAYRTFGGAVSEEKSDYYRSFDVQDSQHNYSVLLDVPPGDYDFRLMDQYGFVVDRHRIQVVLVAPKLNIRRELVAKPSGTTAEMALKFEADKTVVPPFGFGLYGDLFRLGPGGQWEDAICSSPKFSENLFDIFYETDSNLIYDCTIDQGGTYKFLVYFGSDFDHVIADELVFEVDSSFASFELTGALGIEANQCFKSDEDVEAQIDVDEVFTEDNMVLELYHLGSNASALYSNEVEDFINKHSPQDRWEMVQGQIGGDDTDRVGIDIISRTIRMNSLSPGHYLLALSSPGLMNDSNSVVLARSSSGKLQYVQFTVLPPEGSASISVNNNGPVYAGIPYYVDFTLPRGFTSDDERLFIQVVRKGGELELSGSLRVRDVSIANTWVGQGLFEREIELSGFMDMDVSSEKKYPFTDSDDNTWVGDTRFESGHVLIPGNYEARLCLAGRKYDIRASAESGSHLLATSSFEVIVPQFPGSISCPEKIEVKITDSIPCVSIPLTTKVAPELAPYQLRMSYEIYRLGETTLDGARRYPRMIAQIESWVEEDLRVDLNAGHYEIRLYTPSFDFLGIRRRFLLDRKQFTVLNTNWKGPINLTDTIAPTDLAAADAPFFPPIMTVSTSGKETVKDKPDKIIKGLEETDDRTNFFKFVREHILPDLDKTPFTKEVLHKMIEDLLVGFYPEQAKGIVKLSLDRLKTSGTPKSPVRFADIMMGLLSDRSKSEENQGATQSSKLLRASFAGTIIENKEEQSKWKITEAELEGLQGSLDVLNEELATDYDKTIKESRDLNKTISELGKRLYIFGLPASNHSDVEPYLRQVVEQQLKRYGNENQTKLGAPETTIASVQELLAGLRMARKFINRSISNTSLVRRDATMSLMHQAYVKSYHLLARANRQLMSKARGEIALAYQKDIDMWTLAESQARLSTGELGKALQLARGVRSQDKNTTAMRAKTLVCVINRIESVYDMLDGDRRAEVGNLSALRAERENHLKLLMQTGVSEADRIAAALEIVQFRERDGKHQEATDILHRAWRENPSNPVLAGEVLYRRMISVSENSIVSQLHDWINQIPAESCAATLAIAIKKAGKKLSLETINAIADSINGIEGIGKGKRKSIEVLTDFARISAVDRQSLGPDRDRHLAQLIDSTKEHIVLAETLDPDVQLELRNQLDDMKKQTRLADELREALRTEGIPKPGFKEIAKQALSIGRFDLAADALIRYMDVFDLVVPDDDYVNELQYIKTRIMRYHKVLADRSLTKQQREHIKKFLDKISSGFQELLNKEIARVITRDYENSVLRAEEVRDEPTKFDRRRQKVVESLRNYRILKRIQIEAKYASIPVHNLEHILLEQLKRATSLVNNWKVDTERIINQYGLDDYDDDEERTERELKYFKQLNRLRAERDAIQDYLIHIGQPYERVLKQGDMGFLESRSHCFWARYDAEIKLNGFSTSYDHFNTIKEAQEYGVRPQLIGLDKDSAKYIILENEEEYLERRITELIEADPSLDPVEYNRKRYRREALKWKSWGIQNKLFTILNLGDDEWTEKAEERFKFLSKYREDTRISRLRHDAEIARRTSDPQRFFKAIVELREMSLAGELKTYVDYLHVPWYDAGPARAYNLSIGMKSSQKALEWIMEESGRLHQALIRASYRPEGQLSISDRTLLTQHGFLEGDKYAIPEHVKEHATRVGSEFVRVTQEGDLAAIDRILNARRAGELAVTVVVPGKIAHIAGERLLLAMERAGHSWLRARLTSFVVEVGVFTGASRAAMTALDPQQMLQAEMWSAEALGKEFLHNMFVLGALKLYGGTMRKAAEMARNSASLRAATTEALVKHGAFLGEACVLYECNSLLESQHITQESYVENLFLVVMMRGADPKTLKSIYHQAKTPLMIARKYVRGPKVGQERAEGLEVSSWDLVYKEGKYLRGIAEQGAESARELGVDQTEIDQMVEDAAKTVPIRGNRFQPALILKWEALNCLGELGRFDECVKQARNAGVREAVIEDILAQAREKGTIDAFLIEARSSLAFARIHQRNGAILIDRASERFRNDDALEAYNSYFEDVTYKPDPYRIDMDALRSLKDKYTLNEWQIPARERLTQRELSVLYELAHLLEAYDTFYYLQGISFREGMIHTSEPRLVRALDSDFSAAIKLAVVTGTRPAASNTKVGNLLSRFEEGGLDAFNAMAKEDQSIFMAAMLKAKTARNTGTEALTDTEKHFQKRLADAANQFEDTATNITMKGDVEPQRPRD